MSSNLTWAPAVREHKFLDEQLKFKLREKGDFCNPIYHSFTESDIPFLEGLSVCGIKGAAKLIKLINKHDEIVVREIYL